jgi:hypothetical protein
LVGPRNAAPSFPPLELPDDPVVVPPLEELVVDELELPHAAIISAAATHASTMIDACLLREPAPLDFFFIFSPPLTNWSV